MDQPILLHKQNKKVRSEKVMEQLIPDPKHPVTGWFSYINTQVNTRSNAHFHTTTEEVFFSS